MMMMMMMMMITVLLYDSSLLCGFNLAIKGLTGSDVQVIVFTFV